MTVSCAIVPYVSLYADGVGRKEKEKRVLCSGTESCSQLSLSPASCTSLLHNITHNLSAWPSRITPRPSCAASQRAREERPSARRPNSRRRTTG